MTRRRTWLGLLAAVLTVVLLWWQQGDGALTADEPAAPASGSPTQTAPTQTAPTLPSPSDTGTDPVSGLPYVAAADLPPEARETLGLIDDDGPYPYDQDDSVFQNREGILPDQPEGYYREYTVATPGSDDRGARRIVAGSGGEFYWTDDHYASFSRIAR